jgi:hypothetical protein
MSQTDKIVDYLKNGGTLTSLDALRMFGCFRLASRISEIKQHHRIETEMIKTDSGKTVAQYRLVKEGCLF